MTNDQKLKIVYFGGEPLGTSVLDILKENNLIPDLIVCSPDRPSGRKMLMTPPPVKVWAEENSITCYQPESLKNRTELNLLDSDAWDIFIVVAYNHILPEWLIERPKFKTLNLHPSLLPKLRGPSPIRTAITENKPEDVGVTVMLMDKEMDHGPILAQENIMLPTDVWPIGGLELDKLLTQEGGQLLAHTVQAWISGLIEPQTQDHTLASYTNKIQKEDGLLEIDPLIHLAGQAAKSAFHKIQGLEGWPGTYFFHNEKRVKINDAELTSDGFLHILRVTPEGKKEMDFEVYKNSLKQ